MVDLRAGDGADARWPVDVTRYAPHVEATPERPLGAQLSRRWRKREALRDEIARLTRWPVGDAPARVEALEAEVCWVEGTP